jgi:uncharacterized OsmC-like protein
MKEVVVGHLEGDRYRMVVRGHGVTVDQPVDAGGTDEGPTPTELFVGSLATCAAFFAGRFLRRHLSDDQDFSVEARFAMADRPSRVTRVEIDLVLPSGIPQAVRDGALAAAERCTVHASIRAPLEIRTTANERDAVPA